MTIKITSSDVCNTSCTLNVEWLDEDLELTVYAEVKGARLDAGWWMHCATKYTGVRVKVRGNFEEFNCELKNRPALFDETIEAAMEKAFRDEQEWKGEFARNPTWQAAVKAGVD